MPLTDNGSRADVSNRVGERCVDRSLRRLGHEPRGEIDHVAHHGVGPPVPRPDVAGEERAAADPDAHRQRRLLRDDPTQRQQHALLLVAGGARRARGQDELAAVGIDVGAEKADLLLVRGLLHDGHQLAERGGGRVGPAFGDQPIDPLEAEECDRHDAVLGRLRAGEDVCAQLGRERIGDDRGVGRPVAVVRRVVGERGRRAEEPPVAPRRAEAAGGQRRGRGGAHHDLARPGALLHAHDLGRGRPGDQQLTVRAPHDEQGVVGAVHPDGHAQLNAAAARVDRSGLAQPPAHVDGAPARPFDVRVTLEQQQERIAAELEQGATVRVGDGEEPLEAGPDRVCEPLGPLSPTAARQLLGELGEARDVDEHARARHDAHGAVRRVREMVEQHARQIRRAGGRAQAVLIGYAEHGSPSMVIRARRAQMPLHAHGGAVTVGRAPTTRGERWSRAD
jgi:hypothetical protein